MSARVFLHVGLGKSGTSYIQAILSQNKATLASDNSLLFPGERWTDQVAAARDALRDNDPRVKGAWPRLVQEVSAWPGDAIVSMEWLATATPQQANRIVRSLRPARVEVIITVRDLARTIPACWQEGLKNGRTRSWPEYVTAVTSDDPDNAPARRFRRHQDVGKVLASWRQALPGDRIHVVTVPPSGTPPTELWNRFCRVLGIEPVVVEAGDSAVNASLGRESAELMLRLNRVCRSKGVDELVYAEMLKRCVAKRCLAARRSTETPLYRVPRHLEDWVRMRSQQGIEAVRTSGAHVVGDLAELEPRFSADEVSDAVPGPRALLDAALDALVGLAEDRWEELERLRRLIEDSEPTHAASPSHWRGRLRRVRRSAFSRLRRLVGREARKTGTSPTDSFAAYVTGTGRTGEPSFGGADPQLAGELEDVPDAPTASDSEDRRPSRVDVAGPRH